MRLTGELKKQICQKRIKNSKDIYSDEHVKHMIRRRLKNIGKIEGKDVWIENDVFMIDDDSMYGLARYSPTTEKAQRYVKEIEFLITALNCF